MSNRKTVYFWHKIYPFLTGKKISSPCFQAYLNKCYKKRFYGLFRIFDCVDDTVESFLTYKDFDDLVKDADLSEQFVRFLDFPIDSIDKRVKLFDIAFPLKKITDFKQSVQCVLEQVNDENVRNQIREYQKKVIIMPQHYVQNQEFYDFHNVTYQLLSEPNHINKLNIIQNYLKGRDI